MDTRPEAGLSLQFDFAEAKTVHGREARKARKERSVGLRKPAELETFGRTVGLISGKRTPGRKPKGCATV